MGRVAEISYELRPRCGRTYEKYENAVDEQEQRHDENSEAGTYGRVEERLVRGDVMNRGGDQILRTQGFPHGGERAAPLHASV